MGKASRGERRPSPGDPLLVAPFVLDGVEHVLIGLPDPAGAAVLETLSRAEREVVCAALSGSSNAQIARARGVASRTIANQLASAFRKLGVSSRAELARLMSQEGR